MADNYSIKNAAGTTVTFASTEAASIQYPIHYALQQTGAVWTVNPQLLSTGVGGSTPYKLISAASNNLTSVKASAGMLTHVTATNNHATNLAYLKLYNKASAPVVASDVPVQVFVLGALGGGISLVFPTGLAFTTGIALAIVGGMADTNNTDVGAAQVAVSLGYK